MTKGKGIWKKKPKLEIKFDIDARREFLSGFHKRKLQKKAFYKAKLEKRLALEKQHIRAEAKKQVNRSSSSHSILPEVERIIGLTQADLDDNLKTKSESFVFGSKTVTISSLDDIHTKLPSESVGGTDSENSDEETHVPATANVKPILKRTTTRLLQQSKAFKASQRFKLKGKRSRAKNKLSKKGGKEGDSTSAASSKRGKSNYHSNSKLNTKVKRGKKSKN